MAGQELLEQGERRRTAIVAFIADYRREHGYAPSIAEITTGVGLASKTAVRHHLATLVEQGRVAYEPGRYRTIRVLS